MSKVIKYLVAYGMWIVDMGLATWLFYISRTTLLALLAQFYKQGNYQYTKMVNLVDRVFVVVLGLGWLIFSVVTEDYYRKGALKEKTLKRFARVTGPLLLCVFVIDLMLFWLQGIEAGDLLRWLILAAELVIGLALIVSGKKDPKNEPN
jgi:hypothetical protein